jgi:hypothetical protein
VNDSGIAVGFYMGAKGQSHSHAYSVPGGWFHRIRISRSVSTTASDINNRGDVAGFYTGAAAPARRRHPHRWPARVPRPLPRPLAPPLTITTPTATPIPAVTPTSTTTPAPVPTGTGPPHF